VEERAYPQRCSLKRKEHEMSFLSEVFR